MGYLNREQSQRKRERIIETLEYFDQHGGNIKEIAEALGYSESSVQRYLTDELVPELTSKEDAKNIKEFLKQMKLEGNKKGGITSSETNEILREENGKFSGNVRK